MVQKWNTSNINGICHIRTINTTDNERNLSWAKLWPLTTLRLWCEWYIYIFTYQSKSNTWPVLSRRPLYTRPNPPSPNKDSGLKFFVAAASSRNVNVCAAMCAVGPSLGIANSFLESEPLLDFNLSKRVWNAITKLGHHKRFLIERWRM